MGNDLGIEGPEILQGTATTHDENHVDLGRPVESSNRPGDLIRGLIALNERRRDQDRCRREALGGDFEHIANRGTRR